MMPPGVLHRVYGLVVQEFYVTRRRMEVLMDILFFPIMNVILFGYITMYIGAGTKVNGQYFILGVLLWEFIVIVQYNVSVSSMWSMWSHNLSNIFIAPISVAEYLVAQVIAAILRTIAVVGFLALGTYLFFDFNILHLGLINILLFTINLAIFSCWLGIALLGLVFRFGQRIQSLTWYTVFLFQPLTAAFFPVSVLPGFLQGLARALPPTYVFEAARQSLTTSRINWHSAFIALLLNLAYTVVAIGVFIYLFHRSKETGQFARNDL
ncbi:MAG TPA: ABC transporter permease [Patescibacteria group bacterium]|nr:ABC transporter permease [Patescibacteria group bacterium]